MQQIVKTVTILSGASLSGAAYIGDGKLTAIQMPAGWTAADITAQGSSDGVTFNDMYDSNGTEVDFPVGASRQIPVVLEGALWIKLRSGTTGLAVNQGADRVITLTISKNPVGRI